MSPHAILVVDDDEASRYVKSRVLQSQGFAVDQAASGERALESIAGRAPDLVLLDVKLPGIDGLETCRIIKQRWPSVFVLHTSAALRRPDDRTRGLDSGADGYLTEPVEPSELVANVRSLLRIRQVEDDLRRTLELNKVLLREVQHRTMNNLQLVQSFLHLESTSVTDEHARERLRTVSHRVMALAKLHQHLYSRGGIDRIDLGSYLQTLIQDTAGASDDGIEFDVRPASLIMDADRGLRLGLIVNELITNALKYAFVGRRSGRITVEVRSMADGGGEILVEDDGIGFDGAAATVKSTRSGLGLSRALADQSDVELIRDVTAPGTRWRLLISAKTGPGSGR
jgi:two-component system, sensor histidine kinase